MINDEFQNKQTKKNCMEKDKQKMLRNIVVIVRGQNENRLRTLFVLRMAIRFEKYLPKI